MAGQLPAEKIAEQPDQLATSAQMAIAMAAAALGTFEPGFISVLVAGLAAGGSALAPVLAAGARRRWQNAETVIDEGERESGRSAGELAAEAVATPSKEQLTAEVFEAAMRTALEAKVVALAKSWVAGLAADDDRDVELERMLVAALARLEAPHVRVLTVLSGNAALSAYRSEQDHFAAGWTVELVARELPDLAGIMHSLLAVLEAGGLIREDRPGPSQLAGIAGYRILGLGKLALERLAAASA